MLIFYCKLWQAIANAQTVRMSFSMPFIDDVFVAVSGNNLYTHLIVHKALFR